MDSSEEEQNELNLSTHWKFAKASQEQDFKDFEMLKDLVGE